MDEFSDVVAKAVGEIMHKLAAARERWCEAALASGVYGVRETVHSDRSVSFALSPDVPYGQIHVVYETGYVMADDR